MQPVSATSVGDAATVAATDSSPPRQLGRPGSFTSFTPGSPHEEERVARALERASTPHKTKHHHSKHKRGHGFHLSLGSMGDLSWAIPTDPVDWARRVLEDVGICITLGWQLWGYLGMGYKWTMAFYQLLLYAALLLPGFIQMIFFYYFSPRVIRSIPYGPGPRQRLDMYLPEGYNKEQTYPVCIFVTGGAWTIGYKAWGALLARRLSGAGVLVASLDYRNFPQGNALQMLEDVNTGIAWMCDKCGRYQGDPDNVVLVSQSAGGQLAALALLKQAEVASGRQGVVGAWPHWRPCDLRAFVGVSGAYDLEGLQQHLHRRGLYKNLFQQIMSIEGVPCLDQLSPLTVARGFTCPPMQQPVWVTKALQQHVAAPLTAGSGHGQKQGELNQGCGKEDGAPPATAQLLATYPSSSSDSSFIDDAAAIAVVRQCNDAPQGAIDGMYMPPAPVFDAANPNPPLPHEEARIAKLRSSGNEAHRALVDGKGQWPLPASALPATENGNAAMAAARSSDELPRPHRGTSSACELSELKGQLPEMRGTVAPELQAALVPELRGMVSGLMRPAQQLTPGDCMPPVLLIHGTTDNSVPHASSEQLHEALLAAGVDSTLRLVPDKSHTSFLLEGPMSGGRDLLMDMIMPLFTSAPDPDSTLAAKQQETKEPPTIYPALCPSFLCWLAGRVCPF